MGQNPTLATIDVLASIWQRVLQRPSVNPDDNFFDLGGDPSSAVQLFSEIAKVCGRELPALTIYQAPTVGALAALLEQSPTPQFPTLVSLKAGANRPRVFVTHGMGGSLMETFYMVKGVQSEHPICGLQSKGFAGDEEPLARVEDIAELYLGAMKEVQPRGPYALIGYSFGGLVMMEIAQRLRNEGEKIALLTMVETYPDRNLLPLRQRLTLFAGLAKRHATLFAPLTLRKKVAYLRSGKERLYASWNHGTGSKPLVTGLLPSVALERFRDAGALALARYRPRFYEGKLNYIRAARISSSFPDDPKAIWQKLAEQFEIDTVPGDHFGIMTTDSRGPAAVLSRQLASAFAEK